MKNSSSRNIIGSITKKDQYHLIICCFFFCFFPFTYFHGSRISLNSKRIGTKVNAFLLPKPIHPSFLLHRGLNFNNYPVFIKYRNHNAYNAFKRMDKILCAETIQRGTSDNSKKNETREFDYLVIGAGSGGMSYIYVCIYMHTYIYKLIYWNAYFHLYQCMYVYLRMDIDIYIYIYINIYVHVYE